MRRLRLLLSAATVFAGGGLVSACEDVPLLPKWDADWVIPLPVEPVVLTDVFPTAVILPAMEGDVTIPVQEQSLDQAVGEVLSQEMRFAVVALRYTMPLPLVGSDTVFVADAVAELTNPVSTRRIVFPIALAQTGTDGAVAADTLEAGSPQLEMLRHAETLYVQIRGSVRNPGTDPVVLTPSDVIGLSLRLTARIAVSR